MADAPVKTDDKGARLVAVLTGTTQVLDCTTLARRWIRIWADQDIYYFMSSVSTVGLMDTAASAKALGSSGIPFECSSGPAGQPILIDPKTPFLHVRGKTATAQVQIKTTSDAQSGE